MLLVPKAPPSAMSTLPLVSARQVPDGVSPHQPQAGRRVQLEERLTGSNTTLREIRLSTAMVAPAPNRWQRALRARRWQQRRTARGAPRAIARHRRGESGVAGTAIEQQHVKRFLQLPRTVGQRAGDEIEHTRRPRNRPRLRWRRAWRLSGVSTLPVQIAAGWLFCHSEILYDKVKNR